MLYARGPWSHYEDEYLPLFWEKYKNMCLLPSLPLSFKGLVTSSPMALGALAFLGQVTLMSLSGRETQKLFGTAPHPLPGSPHAPRSPEAIQQNLSWAGLLLPSSQRKPKKEPVSIPPIQFTASGGRITTNLGPSLGRQPLFTLCLRSANFIRLFSNVLNILFQSLWN